MLRVVLIDDEPLARQGLRQMLSAHEEIVVVAEAASAVEALDLISREKPDALFLDVKMPGADGFSLLQSLENPPRVVFVTAHAEHAVRAFEVRAEDYLLKPVRPERLAEALRRLAHACGGAEEESSQPYRANDRLCLRTPERTLVVPLARISALEADGDFTRFFPADEAALLICRPLGYYAGVLPSPPFIRLDRSLIINRDGILRLERVSRDAMRLWMRGLPAALTLGRTAQARLKAMLE